MFDRYDGDRTQWIWRIYDATTGDTLATGDDLRSGSGDDSPVSALASLLSFLGAWAESVDWSWRNGRRGENVDLFPASLADAAQATDWNDWASMAQMAVEGDN